MIKWKKAVKVIAAALTVTVLAGTGTYTAKAAGEGDTKAAAKVKITVPNNEVLTYEYRKPKDFKLEIQNIGDEEIKNFQIGADLKGEDSSRWPFKTDWQKYSEKIDKLDVGESKTIKFTFTERDDISTGRYMIHFNYEADGDLSGNCSFYVNTTKKPETKTDSDNKDTDKNKTPQTEPGMTGGADAGGFSNSEPMFSGGGQDVGGGSGDGSVPRVIVTGFSTNPKEVKAGSDFTLTIHLKNTSKKSRVRNMLFDLNAPEEGADEQTTAPAFLPSSGSSAIYLDGIKANGTADISIKLNAKSDLLQKPYSVELSMKYEDANYNEVEAASSLSIPVKQDARFEFSEFQITPESIEIEDEANVMCNLYNMGRIKLYNVKAVFEGDCIQRQEVFVGNVESGATAAIDAMLKGTKESQGPAAVTMTMSYENEEGEVSTEEKELMLEVSQMQEEDMEASMMPEDGEAGQKLPIVPIIIGVLAVIAIVAAVIVRKKRKKRQSVGEEEELLYELDGTSEDEFE